MANIHENITPDREFLASVDLFNEEVKPQINKLKFIADAVDSIKLDEENFIDSGEGLYHILYEIIEGLDKYKNDLNAIWDLYSKRNKIGRYYKETEEDKKARDLENCMVLFEEISHIYPEKKKPEMIKLIHAAMDKKYSKEGKEKGPESKGKKE